MGKWIRRAGLDQLHGLVAPAGPEQAESIMRNIVGKAFEADAVVPLLAGALEREGEPWTEAQAKETMELLAAVADPGEKDLLLSCLAELLAGFLSREPEIWKATLSSLRPASPDPKTDPRAPNEIQGQSSPRETAASGHP